MEATIMSIRDGSRPDIKLAINHLAPVGQQQKKDPPHSCLVYQALGIK